MTVDPDIQLMMVNPKKMINPIPIDRKKCFNTLLILFCIANYTLALAIAEPINPTPMPTKAPTDVLSKYIPIPIPTNMHPMNIALPILLLFFCVSMICLFLFLRF